MTVADDIKAWVAEQQDQPKDFFGLNATIDWTDAVFAMFSIISKLNSDGVPADSILKIIAWWHSPITTVEQVAEVIDQTLALRTWKVGMRHLFAKTMGQAPKASGPLNWTTDARGYKVWKTTEMIEAEIGELTERLEELTTLLAVRESGYPLPDTKQLETSPDPSAEAEPAKTRKSEATPVHYSSRAEQAYQMEKDGVKRDEIARRMNITRSTVQLYIKQARNAERREREGRQYHRLTGTLVGKGEDEPPSNVINLPKVAGAEPPY